MYCELHFYLHTVQTDKAVFPQSRQYKEKIKCMLTIKVKDSIHNSVAKTLHVTHKFHSMVTLYFAKVTNI